MGYHRVLVALTDRAPRLLRRDIVDNVFEEVGIAVYGLIGAGVLVGVLIAVTIFIVWLITLL